MEIHTNIPLKNYTTMRIGGSTRFMSDVMSADSLPELYQNAQNQELPVAVIGSGSNTIVTDDGFDGLILRIRIPGTDIIVDDLHSTTFKLGAGVIWDDFVKQTVDLRLSGVEAMSAIPGTVGAAPVQNIGAYGQELADTFVSLEAYDIKHNKLVTLRSSECRFSYRSSIFRDEMFGRFIITSVTLKLSKNLPSPPFYASLQKYFDNLGITSFTHQAVRDAVTEIRKSKLPDPKAMPNAGSFFHNAIIEEWLLNEIKQNHPDVPHYDMGHGRFKVPSGWLIEIAGFKGKTISGIHIHDDNALVLINQDGAADYQGLDQAREDIINGVRDKFRISLKQEPLEL